MKDTEKNSKKITIKKLKKMDLKDKKLSKHMDRELNEFSISLVVSIEKAGSTGNLNQIELRDKERNKQYISKLIEFIGKCGKNPGKSETTKYLLMSFIRVLDIAGNNQPTPKEKHKAMKLILVVLFLSIAYIGYFKID